jgi:hypothetical protein
MKHLSLLFCLLLAGLFSFSQVENYDLSKYKLPDIKRQQMDFDFQSGGQSSSSKYFSYYPNYSDTIKDVNNRLQGIIIWVIYSIEIPKIFNPQYLPEHTDIIIKRNKITLIILRRITTLFKITYR